MADLKAPKTSTLRGEVVGVSNPIESKNKKGSYFRIVTFEDWNTKGVYQRPISEQFFQGSNGGSGMKSVLVEGKFAEVTLDHLVAGETEYMNSEGTIETHTSTSEVISKATNISAARYQMDYKASLYQPQA